jgi:hypothetical protein
MSVLVSTVLITLPALAWGSVYMVNDDLAMASFVNGEYTGTPTPYLVFGGGVWGLVLAGAYGATSAVPWYPVSVLAVAGAGIAALGTIVWRRRGALGPERVALVTFATLLMVPTLVLSISFTASAIFLGIASLMTVMASASMARAHGRWALVAGMAGLWIAGVMRIESLIGLMVVFAPTAVVAIMRLGRRRALAGAGVLVVLLLVSGAVDRVIDDRGGWPAFHEYNSVRGDLHGSAGLAALYERLDDPGTMRDLEAAGWSIDEVLLFDAWVFDDPVVYSREQLVGLRDLVGGQEFRRSLSDAWGLVVDGRQWFSGAIVLAALVALWRSTTRGRLLVIVQLPWAAAAATATAWGQRFPDRVAIPMMGGLAIVLLLGPHLWGADRPVDPYPAGSAVLAVAVSAAAIVHTVADVGAYSFRGLDAINDTRRSTYAGQMAELEGVDRDGRFVYAGAYIMVEGVDAFRTPGAYGNETLLGLGWPTFSPLYEARRAKLGLEGNLLEQFVRQDSVYLVIGPPFVPSLEREYRTRLGLDVQLEQLAQLTNGGGVYQVRLIGPPSVPGETLADG